MMTGTGILKGFFNGKELWSRDIQKEYGQFGLMHGYASSPLLFEDSLYVQVLHGMKTDDLRRVMRIDKKNGKTLWRNRIALQRHSLNLRMPTPRLLRYGEQRRSLSPAAIASLVTTTGKRLWRANGLNPENSPMYRIVASPIIFGEIIYAPTRVNLYWH